MTRTSIEWTHRPQTGGEKGGYSWNPIRARRKSNGKVGWACTHASPGCIHCYAETINKRFGTGLPFNVPSLDQVEFFLDPKALETPAKLKKPATIFVGDMFDLFHEQMPQIMIAQVLWAALQAPQHVFQFLTKRAGRMLSEVKEAENNWYEDKPPQNMWFGVSVESQKYADERIPLLLQTPAAVRFLSVEPMLEAVGIAPWLKRGCKREWCGDDTFLHTGENIDWVICGGESGPKARPFETDWAGSLMAQCQEAHVAFFMKQLGSNSFRRGQPLYLKDRKGGGSMEEWPEHLRVREFPG